MLSYNHFIHWKFGVSKTSEMLASIKLTQRNGAQTLTQKRNRNEDCADKVSNERGSATILRNHIRKAPSAHFVAEDCLNIKNFVRCEI
jgi:hypothetical protein